jgi:CheY-like chemotaxis protein
MFVREMGIIPTRVTPLRWFTGRTDRMAHILIVDDDPEARRIFSSALYYNGFSCQEAATGMEGIAAAKELRPDLIVMDVKLPDMSGMLAAEILKAHAGFEHVPVVCVTATDLPAKAAVDRGCAAVLYKPLQPAELVTAVRKWLAAKPD